VKGVVLLLSFVSLPAFAQTTVAGSTPGSFRVTEGGAAEYRIPIRVPPGVAGMEPGLALAYNSHAGNGLLGVGWGLEGLSEITRCPRTMAQDGVRGGVNYDANDRFCLDGQRLVAISGTHGADGTEYRTERESFTKVISYGVAGNGPAWFKAWTKSGQIIEYGNTADSRIEAQGKTTVRAWAVNKVSDTKGNYLTVSYTEDNANGDYRPSRADYGVNSVRFEYESRSDALPQYQGGSLMKMLLRMTRAKTYLGSAVVADYRLAYGASPNTPRSRLLSITECTGDGSACKAPTTLSYNTVEKGWVAGGSQFHPPYYLYSRGLDNEGTAFVDVNGDGLVDMVRNLQVGSALHTGAWLNTGNGWVSSSQWVPPYVLFSRGYDNEGTAWIDVNGDGLPDLVRYLQVGSALYTGAWLNNGSGWTVSSQYVPPLPLWSRGYDDEGAAWADMNGDGLPDMVRRLWVAGTDYAGAWLNGGTGTFAAASVSLAPPYFVTSRGYDHEGTMFVDLNGDGLVDFVRNLWVWDGSGYSTNTGAWLNTGAGWISAPQFIPPYPLYTRNGGGSEGVEFVDVNGDGLPDMVRNLAVECCTLQNAWINTGSGWQSAPEHAPPLYVYVRAGHNDSNGAAFIDVNGDGLPDQIQKLQWGGATYANAYLNKGSRPDLVTSIVDGNGGVVSLAFSSLSTAGVYTKDTTAAYPIIDVQVPMHVVSQVTVSTGSGGTRVSTYSYGGAKSIGDGRSFLGFRWQEATDQSSGLKVRTENRQDWPYVGVPSLVRKTQSSGAVLGETSNTYSCKDPASGAACAVAAGNRYFPFASQSVETGNDLNAAVLPTVTTTTAYDNYGNATSVVVSTGDGYSKTTTNTFVNDTVNWFLGRLTRSSVQSVTP
jgi:hypothetical protein